MIRRYPFPPNPRVILGSCALFWLSNCLEKLGMARQSGITPSASQVLLTVLCCSLPMAMMLPSYPLTRWLRLVEPVARGPRWWCWLGFLSIFFWTLALGCWVEGRLLEHILGWAHAGPWEFWARFGPVPAGWLMFMFLEQATAFAHATSVEERALVRAIDQLFVSREALLQARSRGRQEVAASLADRAAPRLLAIAGAVEALIAAGEPPPPRRLAALREEIEDVSEEEFRRLSHVLHPSIVQVGLLPAVRSLLATFDGAREVVLDVPPGAEEGAPLDEGFSSAAVLAAYRAIEASLDQLARSRGATRVVVSLARTPEGHLRVAVAHDAPGREEEHPVGLALIESRVALAGGRWSLTRTVAGERMEVQLDRA